MQPLGLGSGQPLQSSKPTNPISNIVSGINNIINAGKQFATSFIKAATVPVQSNLAVYNPPPTYPPPIQLSGLYGYGTTPSQPLQTITSQYVQPLQTYNYVENSRQPISVTIQPQPITINVPSSNTPIIGPMLPAIEQALAPFVASIGQVVNPLVALANKVTSNQFAEVEKTVNKVVYDAYLKFQGDMLNRQLALENTINKRLQDTMLPLERTDSVIKAALDKQLQEQRTQQAELGRIFSNAAEALNKSNEAARRLFAEADNLSKREESAKQKLIEDKQLDLFQEAARLFAKIFEVISNFNNIYTKGLHQGIGVLSGAVHDAAKDTINGYDAVLNDLKSGKLTSLTDFINRLHSVGADDKMLWSALNLFGMVSIILTTIKSAANPLSDRIEQLANADYKQNLLTADQYSEYIRRFPNQSRWAFQQLYKLGLNDEQIAVLFENATALLDLDRLISANLRGIVSDKDYASQLSKLGYDDTQQKTINSLRLILPPVQDLIVMAVREVFSPEQRKLLSLDENFPEEFGKIAKQQGLSETWARNYWASHWQLPSPQQVFEMLHRRHYDSRLRDVDDNFVAAYLKAADYAPVWRDKMQAISYNTLTRVDIRRMFKAGTLNDAEMHSAHLALGLTERDAAFLDDFVRKTNLPEDETDLDKIRGRIERLLENRYIAGAIDVETLRTYMRNIGKSDDYINNAIPLFDMERYVSGLENEAENIKQRAISTIISARQRGNISRAVATRQLVALGLSDSQALQSIIFADLQYEIQLKSKAQDVYQRQYALHNINGAQFLEALKAYDFSNQEAQRALLEAELMRADKTKKLTQAQLKSLVDGGVITQAQYITELEAQGLTNQSISWILSLQSIESETEQ